jgi:histidinol dehydrogenase
MADSLNIQRFNTRKDSIATVVAALRDKLSPGGDVVSAAGRQRTIDVFGEPLTPNQVVQRICADVRNDGLSAVLNYTKSLDNVELDADSLRVSAAELHAAHAAADPEFLATIGRIRDNIFEFQQAILHSDVALPTTNGVSLCQRYTPLGRAGLCVPELC